MTTTLPGIGLTGGYAAGENDWDDTMNANLERTSVLGQLSVINILATLPGSPANGDIYALTAAAGAHPTEVAWRKAGAWVYFVPTPGWRAFNLTDDTMYAFHDGDWEVVNPLPSGGTIGQVLTKQSSDDGDADWEDGGSSDLPISIGFGFTTVLDVSEPALLYTFAEAVTFADDFAGSVGDVGTNPAATFTLDVRKNGSSIGSIAIGTGGAFTFSTSGGAASFAIGDQLRIIGPASAGTAENVSITLLGTRD